MNSRHTPNSLKGDTRCSNKKICGNGIGLQVSLVAIYTFLVDKNAVTRKKSQYPIEILSVFGYYANEQKCINPQKRPLGGAKAWLSKEIYT